MKKNQKNFSPMTYMMKKNLETLPTPMSISYLWNGGSLLGIFMTLQILTGLILSMHYCPNINMAFESTIHIMREVNMGWLLRYLHMNGASLLFILIFFHVSRGMNFSSQKKKETWFTGLMLILLLMATAFMGYVLPWGQMSFWGATVITNLLSAIPIIGKNLVLWLWGGFSINNATLNRFFTIHFITPFLILLMSMIHLSTLHEYMSSNPTGTQKKNDLVSFHPFFSWKDFNPIVIISMILLLTSILKPNILGDPENFNMANSMITPIHIQPEWYFLFAYAILRAIPNKLGGVLALMMSICIIMVHSMKKKTLLSTKFNPISKTKFTIISSSFILLTWLGANPIEPPFIMMSQITSMIYFFFMFTL